MALDQVKQDILKAALSEFASFGFEGTRIEAIINRADLIGVER